MKVVHAVQEEDLLDYASSLAFSFLLALFPLLLFMLALFGLFASRSSELQTSLLSYFADFLPPSAFQLLNDTTKELAKSSSGGKLTFGIILALWFGSGGISSMISTLNGAYHVRESRSWLRIRAVALGLTVAISILLLAALFILLAGGQLVDWIGLKLSLASSIVILWKGMQWVAAGALRDSVFLDDLLLRTELRAAALVLGNPRLHFRGNPLAGRFGRISCVSALLQYLHGDLRVAGRGDHSSGLAVRDWTRVSGRRADQC